jgi:predicted nucleotidyltransferase
MAYNVPFIFDPLKKSASFNSAQTKVTDLGNTGIPVGQNPYISNCNDTGSNVKDNYRGMVANYASNFGMSISYWSTGYNLNNQNEIYGEDPTARYRGPRKMKAVIDFQSYTTFLTKFGVMSDLDIVIYIPIQSFREVWGEVVPLAGDLFLIDDSACDRPLGQSPIVFEITEKHDAINPADFMGGHFVWRLTAKRYDNSYEPGAPQEKFLGGPVDSGDYGKIESSIDNTIVVEDPSPTTVDEEAKEDFNTPNDSVYGKYY